MRTLLSQRLVNLGVGAAVLLTLLWVSPASRAACSHLARPLGDLQQMSSLTGLQGLMTTAPGLEDRGSFPRRPPPCSGPSCSGQIPLPASTSIATVAPASLWGLLGRPLELGTGPVRFLRDPGQPLPRSHMTSSIFHPPRPVV